MTGASRAGSYAFLDALPTALRRPTVVNPHGALLDRGNAVVALRAALLEGRAPAPEDLAWPAPELRDGCLEAITKSGVAGHCAGDPDLADAVVRSVLDAAEHAEQLVDYATLALLELSAGARAQRLEEKLRGPRSGVAGSVCRGGRGVGGRSSAGELENFDEESQRKARVDGARLAEAAARTHAEELAQSFEERVRCIKALRRVFDELAQHTAAGWDLSRSALSVLGWDEATRVSELLAMLPKLRAVIAALGRLRLRERDDGESALLRRGGPVRRVEHVARERAADERGPDVRGVERSDDIARMLPSEAAMLVHPVLRLLFHARRSERGLLTYLAEGVRSERVPECVDLGDGLAEPAPRPDHGPVLVCLDTSGSMAGPAETVAKALVLHLCCVAQAEGRRCYVYSFSGPGDVVEHEFRPGPEALARLLLFLGRSFHGGTDVDEPLRRALARLREKDWAEADVVVISDGCFHVPPATRAEARHVRGRRGAKIHGVLIGPGPDDAMRAVCDPVHRFADFEDRTAVAN